MDWKLTSKELPKRQENTSYSQVPCLVNKMYYSENDGISTCFYQIQILVFNHEHQCWDAEDGDDYDCDIHQVKHWMYLPKPPI